MCGLLSVKTRKTQHSRDPQRTTHDALPMTHLPTRFSHPPDKYNLFHLVSYELKKKLEPAIIWKLVTCQQITKKLIGRHLSPRYGQVILVSGYPVLTADVQYECSVSLLGSQTTFS